jgi:hypothetical protein
MENFGISDLIIEETTLHRLFVDYIMALVNDRQRAVNC